MLLCYVKLYIHISISISISIITFSRAQGLLSWFGYLGLSWIPRDRREVRKGGAGFCVVLFFFFLLGDGDGDGDGGVWLVRFS